MLCEFRGKAFRLRVIAGRRRDFEIRAYLRDLMKAENSAGPLDTMGGVRDGFQVVNRRGNLDCLA